MRNFIILLGKHRREYVLVIACTALLTGGEALIQPLLMKAIFDGVTNQSSFRSFIPLGLGYLLLGITVNVLAYLNFNWRTKLDNKILSSVSADLLRSYYAVPYAELLEKGSGYYVARVRSDVKDGMAPMLITVRDTLAGIISFSMLITVLIYISFPAFITLVVLIPICAAISLLVSRKIRGLTTSERDNEATIVDVLTRAIAALKIVRQHALDLSTITTFANVLDRGLETSYARSRMVRLLQAAGDMTRVMSDVSSIFVGAFLVIRHEMTIGSFIAFMNAFWRSSSTLFTVLNKWADMHSYGSIIDRISDFQRDRPPARLHSVGKEVVLQNVSFSYADEQVVNCISLNVKQHERILITGENGSGKTTLANIICGLLAPSGGTLTLPGRVAGATLPIHFPPTSVESLNIDKALLDRFGLGSDIVAKSRPDFLSTGQQQKLAVALAISFTADLYVLDEPFSNLDSGSRELMLQEILERTEGRMLVMILHEPAEYSRFFDRCVNIKRPPSKTAASSELGQVEPGK